MKKLGTFLLFVVLLASGVVGFRFRYSAQVKDAQGFCESIIPKLETVRTQTGKYPTNLGTILLQTERLPALLRDAPFYKSDGRQYSLTFEEPLAWDNFWTYTSSVKRWMNFDCDCD